MCRPNKCPDQAPSHYQYQQKLHAGLVLQQQLFQRDTVSVLERLDIRHAHTFVELVDSGIQWTEFNNLRADIGDETPIRSAARRGEFWRDTISLLDSIRDGLDQLTRWGDVGRGIVPFQVVVEAVFIQD